MILGNEFSQVLVKTTGAEINVCHGGNGAPLLLLHGYPQTSAIWHLVTPFLTSSHHVICADLRGYGDSSKPPSSADHFPYSKRAMARDMLEVMSYFGYQQFYIAGHDRGARVTHRMALDYPTNILKACVMDITPTLHMFESTNQVFATGYFHWYFLIQPDELPERMIGYDPEYFLTEILERWSGPDAAFSKSAVEEYIRCFSQPESIHASCEDYRAAASIDLVHDRADINQKIECPLLVLWGLKGFIQRNYDVLEVWNQYATQVQGQGLNCGHFLPEEESVAVVEALTTFFDDSWTP